jgi:hypothetical protein
VVAGKSTKELNYERKDGVSFKTRYGLQIDTVEIEKDNALAAVVYQ